MQFLIEKSFQQTSEESYLNVIPRSACLPVPQGNPWCRQGATNLFSGGEARNLVSPLIWKNKIFREVYTVRSECERNDKGQSIFQIFFHMSLRGNVQSDAYGVTLWRTDWVNIIVNEIASSAFADLAMTIFRFGRRYFSFILLMIVFTLEAKAQKAEQQTAFGVGERLLFDVNFGIITAGYAEMTIPQFDTVKGNTVYKVQFTVRSTPTFDFFFEVRDRYETYLDSAGIFPWRFEQHIKEGKFKRDYTANFDQQNHIARTGEGDFDIPGYVHDIMSAFYYARTIDYTNFKVGQRVHLSNFFKGKTNPLDIKYLGKQKVEVDAGTFNCIIVEPMVKEGGLFKSEGRILIWMTDDERKIPVKVNTKVIIGSIDAELREYSGLNGPLKAKVQ